ncbi:MAG: UDP-N-acetylglucosamine 1-carboxyvinyltransferase [Candidatus Amulumruptor caecigallinarius]|nr:UDP-N-acetylglucosamine 1-carboxyvinyltransferase [Candidatus Amulumruptor caecigallinarius]MCM1397709.1 UDP-N-acetylglucosamine 1-carboxyvinyltransferase [Candidatus Amulumruptor caecigallinarius]MCM1454725.1 UDP-N-acetylglucosamine 1-carboxyvinyltransferase [bacterium]
MSSFIIEGGRRLSGSITPQGAKNEALQIISATLLTDKPVHVTNIPEISDVVNLIALLEAMGVKAERHGKGDYTFVAAEIDASYLESDDFTRRCAALRGSVLVVGPLLTRLGRAWFAKPGGDKIGRRKVDTHIQGLMNLGATLGYDDSRHAYLLSTPKPRDLKGCYMLLDEASVTGTANIIMAATMAHGDTTIYNAACEPYLQQLCRLLTAMGAKIDGIGSNLVTVHGTGGELLGGASHRVLPDMIEIGSFIGMAAITRSDLTIRDVSVADLGIIPESFRRLGIDIEVQGDDLHIPAKESYVIEKALDGTVLTLADAPWPGLSPDLLSVMLVTATQCSGAVLIHQKMFESRLFFVDHLIEMGAQIILCDPHRAVVIGLDHKTDLHPNFMKSPDIRAGIAMLLAAMSTPGRSVIGDIEQIDRGYEHIDTRLNALGACITRQP